jgi:glycerol-3-phosphate dehydrogenase
VKPIEVVFPSQSWLGGLMPAMMSFLGFNTRIKERGALLVELGLRIYDFYNRKVQALPDHRFFGKRKLHAEHPDLAPELLAGGVYYEGRVTHAERLGLELVLDGLAANPESGLSTYTKLSGHPEGNRFSLRDEITGKTHEVTANIVINAAGAWIDKVNAEMGINSVYMGGSKGSHLIVRNKELVEALKGRMLYFGCKDGRFNLVYPFFGNALIGSTDIPLKDPDQAFCSSEETDYLLNAVREVFPNIKFTRDEVVLTYCGVRPLPRSDAGFIGSVTRDHAIGRNKVPGTDVPVLCLIGGKWTTFRAFSEQACDATLEALVRPRKLSTEDVAIGGGRDYPKDEKSREALIGRLGSRGRELFERYGTKALAIMSSGDTALTSLPSYSRNEIDFMCKHENVRRLADLLLRRTAITMEGLLSPEVIAETGAIAAGVLGWDKKRAASEIAHATAELARRNVQNVKPELTV